MEFVNCIIHLPTRMYKLKKNVHFSKNNKYLKNLRIENVHMISIIHFHVFTNFYSLYITEFIIFKLILIEINVFIFNENNISSYS